MSCHEAMLTVLDTIERQKDEQLTVKRLAEAAYISPSHLQMLFKRLAGQPLMTYVRGRKLARSLNELYNSDMRIIDIANEYGFAHEQSYERAFRSEFGCLPGYARRERIVLKVRERIDPSRLYDMSGGLMYGPWHVMSPAFDIVGVPTLFRDFNDERDGMKPNIYGKNAYYNKLSKLPGTQSNVYIGLCRRLENSVIYMPGVSVIKPYTVPEDMEGFSFPAEQCVLFRYVGEHPPDNINMISAFSTYMAVRRYFTGQNRYVMCKPYHYERIDKNEYDGVFCRMDLLIPVSDDEKFRGMFEF